MRLSLAVGLLAPGTSHGHLVAGRRSLLELVASAELVVRARILAANPAAGLADPTLRRPVVTASVLETLKGAAPEGALHLAQHGHGTAVFREGEEVLLFLVPLAASPELRRLGSSGALDWVSLQEHDEKYALEPGTRREVLSAARGYAQLATLGDPQARASALRGLTLRLLASQDPGLAASALRDLAGAPPEPPILEAGDLPALQALLDEPTRPVGLRAGLLVELERRGLVQGAERWVALVRSTPRPERGLALRAAGAHPSPAVTAELSKHLKEPDPALAAAAAVALGRPGHEAATPALAALLERPEPQLRNAAIRGLGGIASPRAREALDRAAAAHPDPATRRRARAESARLRGGRAPHPRGSE